MVKYTILIGYLSLTSEKYSPRQFGVRKGILGLQIIAYLTIDVITQDSHAKHKSNQNKQ